MKNKKMIIAGMVFGMAISSAASAFAAAGPQSSSAKAAVSQTAQAAQAAPSKNSATNGVTSIKYSATQKSQIKKAFAQFQGFETAYAPTQMIKGDLLQKVVASDAGVSFLFKHMRIVVSPRDYSSSYTTHEVKLSNGTKGKWYSPDGKMQMLDIKVKDRTVTLSSPDNKLSKAQLEKVAVSVTKLK